jgi:L-alanine-DL-glutamate epimerase-like enolase superfamily enzyme
LTARRMSSYLGQLSNVHETRNTVQSNSAARAAEVVRSTGVRAVKLAADEVLERLKAEGKVSNLFDPARSAGLRLTTAEIDALAGVVASVREAVGPGIGIAVDAHTRFDTEPTC